MNYYYCDNFFWENPFSDEQIRKMNEIADKEVEKLKKVDFSEDEKNIYTLYHAHEKEPFTNDMKNLILKKLGDRLYEKGLSGAASVYFDFPPALEKDDEFIEFREHLDEKDYHQMWDFLDNYDVSWDKWGSGCAEGSHILDIMNDEYYLDSIDIEADDIGADEDNIDVDELYRVATAIYKTKVLAYFFGEESDFFKKIVLNEKGEINDWKYEVK